MYRVYAHDAKARINLGIRRRLAPLLGNDRRRIELMNALLFSLPGTPVIYYGDEIGMGDNIYLGDRNGVRTPMQWSSDRNAGFSQANPQKLFLPVIIDPEYHYESVNVEAQRNNPHSLLNWMKRLIALRNPHAGLRARHDRVPAPAQPQGARLHPRAWRRADPGRREPLALRRVRRARSREVQGHGRVEMFGRNAVPADRRSALSADPRARIPSTGCRSSDPAAARRGVPAHRRAACPSLQARGAVAGVRCAAPTARRSRPCCPPCCARGAGTARRPAGCAACASST